MVILLIYLQNFNVLIIIKILFLFYNLLLYFIEYLNQFYIFNLQIGVIFKHPIV